MKPLSLLFILFALANISSGQEQKIADAVRNEIISSCSVCLKKPRDSVFSTKPSGSLTGLQIDYHNCHLYYTTNQLNSAYKYALQFLNDPHSADDSVKLIHVMYIEAKSLLFKQLYRESLDLYLYLVESSYASREFKINSYINIGAILLIKGEYEKALGYLNQCLDRYDVKDDTSLRNIYNNIAACYLLLKNIDKSEIYFQKCVEISKQMNDTVAIAMAYMGIANQYYTQLRDREAEKYFTKSLYFSLMTNNLQLRQNAYLNMAVVSENNNRYKSAVEYRKKYEAVHDSLYDRDDVWNLSQEQKRLDSLQHLQREELLQQKNLLQQSELAKQNLQRNTFIGLAIVFLAFFFFAFYAYRNKSRQNKIITTQREELNILNHTKDQLFSVVAHDLRSPVQTLKTTMNRLKAALGDKDIHRAEQVSGEIENISNSTYSLLNNLLFWALSQTGQLRFVSDKLNVFRLVEQVLYDYVSVANAKHIDLTNCVDEHVYCNGDINTMKIIIRNLVDNAIKFSEPFTNIMISGNEGKEECVVSVTDNGKGIEEAIIRALDNRDTKRISSSHGQSTGIGLWLVKTMTERHGGTLQIEKQTKGTKISIHLPLYRNHEQTADTYY